MKKSVFGGIFALAFLVIAGYGVKSVKNHARLSYLALENVEALASSSEGTDAGFCFWNKHFMVNIAINLFAIKKLVIVKFIRVHHRNHGVII